MVNVWGESREEGEWQSMSERIPVKRRAVVEAIATIETLDAGEFEDGTEEEEAG